MGNTDPEPEQREIDLDLPFDRVFDECMNALRRFTFREIERFDPIKGTIEARVSNTETRTFVWSLSTGWIQSSITITIRKMNPGKTRVTVTSRTIPLSGFMARCYTKYYGSRRNLENMMIITSFLRSRESEKERESGGDYFPVAWNMPKENWFLIDPQEAALMSLAIPGLGQNYSGDYIRGTVIAAGTAAGLMFFFVPGIVIWLFGAYDAYHLARTINRGSLPIHPVNMARVILHVVFTGVIILFGMYVSFGMIGYYSLPL